MLKIVRTLLVWNWKTIVWRNGTQSQLGEKNKFGINLINQVNSIVNAQSYLKFCFQMYNQMKDTQGEFNGIGEASRNQIAFHQDSNLAYSKYH